MPTSEKAQLRGGAWLIEPTDPREVLTPERLTDEHRLIGNTTQQFVEQEVLPALDRLEQHDWDAGARSPEAVRGSRPARRGRAGSLRRRRPRQGHVAPRQRTHGERGVVRRHVRRADEPHAPAAAPVRHGGTEAEIHPQAADRRAGRRVLPQRNRLGLRRARRQNAGVAPAGRRLRAEWREDVDHERRLRRRLHRLCQGRRRALHGVHRRAGVRRPHERQGRAQDGPAWLVDDRDHFSGRQGAGRQRARRGRQGPQGRVQRAELRPLQAGRHVQRRLARRHRRGGQVCGHAEAVRPAHRELWRHPPQAWRDDRPDVRRREPRSTGWPA